MYIYNWNENEQTSSQIYNNYIRSDKIIDEISSEISNLADIIQIM